MIGRLAKLLSCHADLSRSACLQIGGCDGTQDDPLGEDRRLLGRGWICEPVPWLAEVLRNTVPPSFEVVETAVLDYTGTGSMLVYEPRPEDPLWMRGLATFHPERNCLGGWCGYGLSEPNPGYLAASLKAGTRRITVPVTSLGDLLEKHRVDQVDLLVLDTEGSDLVILRQFPFGELKPAVCMTEFHNYTPDQQGEMLDVFARNGYTMVEKGWDAVAVLENRSR